MKDSQKGFVAPLLIVIAILAIGGSIYWYSHKSIPSQTITDYQTATVTNAQSSIATPTPTPTPSLIPTPSPTPSPSPSSSSYDIRHYKMKFILLINSQASSSDLDKINKVKKAFASTFSSATNYLISMDVSANTTVIQFKPNMSLGKDANGVINNIDASVITKAFFKNNPDNSDFITIYTDFPVNIVGMHWEVKNTIKGIGLSVSDDSLTWGSRGKLRGINFGGYIDYFNTNIQNTTDQIPLLVAPLLHETGHQWCCYVGHPFQGGGTVSLEIINTNRHYYSGLDNTPWLDPMSEGDGQFASNVDGTFKSIILPNIKPLSLFKYNNFSLYFMGVLDRSKYAQKYSIYNVNDMGWPYTRAALYKAISVNDVIAVMGNRSDTGSDTESHRFDTESY